MALDEGYGRPTMTRPRGGIGTPAFRPRRDDDDPVRRLLRSLGEKFTQFEDGSVLSANRFAQEAIPNGIVGHSLHFGQPFSGDRPEYRPMGSHFGDPLGMDTEPDDAMVLRNLLAVRNPDDYPRAPYPIPPAQGVAQPEQIPNYMGPSEQVPLQSLGRNLGTFAPPLAAGAALPAVTMGSKPATFLERMKQRRFEDELERALSGFAGPYQLRGGV